MLKKLVEAAELMVAACPLTVALLRPTVLDGVGMLAPIARRGDTDPGSPCLGREPSPRHRHGERIWPQLATRLAFRASPQDVASGSEVTNLCSPRLGDIEIILHLGSVAAALPKPPGQLFS